MLDGPGPPALMSSSTRTSRLPSTHSLWNSNSSNSGQMALQHQIQELESSNREKDKKIQDLSNQYERLKAHVDGLTTELAAAQAYALKPDEYPGRDILRMVERLNDGIFNTARSIHDLSGQVPRVDCLEMFPEGPNYRERYADLATKAIGEGLYKLISQMDDSLAYRDPETPPQFLPLDLALQFILVQWCSTVVSIFQTIPDAGNVLAGAYGDIRRQEDQPVSARWKIMTMAATHKWEQSKVDDALRQVLAVLCISGMSREKSKSIDFEGKVLKRIQDLEKQALRLKRAMQEGITSGDMELISILPGTIYDPALMQLEDGYGGSGQKDEPVLCTVGLGLRKVVAMKNEKRDFELCTQTMKPATIVLQSAEFS